MQIKKYFLNALKTITPMLPADWEVLFLDCDAACAGETVPKFGATPVDDKVLQQSILYIMLSHIAYVRDF